MTDLAPLNHDPAVLREQLQAAMSRAEAIVSAAEKADRDLTDQESTQHAQLVERAQQLGPVIRQAELTKLRATVASGNYGYEHGFGGGSNSPIVHHRDAAHR
jgi:hypothetical protein